MQFDSLYFMSSQNDNLTSLYRIKGCCFFTTPFDLDKCIKHLEETERMKVIRNDEFTNFITENKDIYYDEYTNNMPACDVIYRKINEHFFVKNDEYFEKFTKFYFTLYSGVFPNLGLKNISLNLSELRNTSKNFNIDFDAIVATAGVNSSQTNNFSNENSIEMGFEKNKSDLNTMININDASDKVQYIYDNILPQNLKLIVFKPGIVSEMDLILNRTYHKLSSFNKTMKVENTNTYEIKAKISKNFKVGDDLGLFVGFNGNTYICHNVNFELSFFDFNTPSPKKYIDFYISITPTVNGPWPINCKEIKLANNINSFEDAKKIAIKYLEEDPENVIIEILEIFSFMNWSYTIKQFRTTEKTADIHVGTGRRYVAFDIKKFRDRNNVVKRLEEEKYFKNY